VVPGTVTKLVRRVGTNGELHKTPITTYRRRPQEDFEDLDVEYQGMLSIFSFCSLLTVVAVQGALPILVDSLVIRLPLPRPYTLLSSPARDSCP
jgi:hypothetical protein